MEKCKHVVLVDTACSHRLEELEKHHYKLNQIEGKIIHCESKREGLVMKLAHQYDSENTDNKEFIWIYDKQMSLPAVCGQRLKCFYKETSQRGNIEEIKIDAYELLGKKVFDNVLRRGINPSALYKFVDYEKAVV